MERISAGILKVLKDVMRRAPAEEAPVLIWPLVCGSAVAQRTKALAFREGALTVQVPDAAWRAQLLELVPQYLEAMNQTVTQPVRELVFVIAQEQK